MHGVRPRKVLNISLGEYASVFQTEVIRHTTNLQCLQFAHKQPVAPELLTQAP